VRFHIFRSFWNFAIVIFQWKLQNLVNISTQITSNKHIRPVEVQTFYKISVLSEKIALWWIVYNHMNQNDASIDESIMHRYYICVTAIHSWKSCWFEQFKKYNHHFTFLFINKITPTPELLQDLKFKKSKNRKSVWKK
jgi:hypothetical protein